jgi:hypothetical protein
MHDLAHAALTSLDAKTGSARTERRTLHSQHGASSSSTRTLRSSTNTTSKVHARLCAANSANVNLASPPEVCHTLSSVRRCSYLVCFCHLTSSNAVKGISAIWFVASPTIRGRLRVLCKTLNSQRLIGLRVLCEALHSQHYVWSPCATFRCTFCKRVNVVLSLARSLPCSDWSTCSLRSSTFTTLSTCEVCDCCT